VHSPYVRCFSCLARRLDVTQAEVRSSAHVLVANHAFTVARQLCYACSRTADTLAPGKDEADDVAEK